MICIELRNGQQTTVFLVTPEGIILADPLRRDTALWLKGELGARFPNVLCVSSCSAIIMSNARRAHPFSAIPRKSWVTVLSTLSPSRRDA